MISCAIGFEEGCMGSHTRKTNIKDAEVQKRSGLDQYTAKISNELGKPLGRSAPWRMIS